MPRKPRRNLVPNAPLREAYLASGMTACEVCRRVGWTVRNTSRLHRQLGIIPHQASVKDGGHKSLQTEMDRAAAELICTVIGVEFHDLYEGIVEPPRAAQRCRMCHEPMMRRDPEGMCGFCREEAELFGQVAVAA